MLLADHLVKCFLKNILKPPPKQNPEIALNRAASSSLFLLYKCLQEA